MQAAFKIIKKTSSKYLNSEKGADAALQMGMALALEQMAFEKQTLDR